MRGTHLPAVVGGGVLIGEMADAVGTDLETGIEGIAGFAGIAGVAGIEDFDGIAVTDGTAGTDGGAGTAEILGVAGIVVCAETTLMSAVNKDSEINQRPTFVFIIEAIKILRISNDMVHGV